MRRQVVIGGLVGIALGGLITFSFAHGLVGWPGNAAPAVTPEADDAAEHDEVDTEVGVAPHRPLRPGSERAGKARRDARALAAAVPPTSDPAV